MSICSDGWSNAQRRPLINIMAVSESGPMFLKAINCKGETKDKHFIADLLINCHAPNPGLTRLADPNRFPGRETQAETLYLIYFLFLFLKQNWYLWVWPTCYNKITISYTFTESHLHIQS